MLTCISIYRWSIRTGTPMTSTISMNMMGMNLRASRTVIRINMHRFSTVTRIFRIFITGTRTEQSASCRKQ